MHKSKILIVEDDPAISNLIRTTLEAHGYQFHAAGTGESALLEIVSYNPEVIVLDLGLPDMDGVDIIRKVRSFSTTPIIVVSARSDDRDKVEALDAGADDFLTKPFSIDEFLARLRAALRRWIFNETVEKSSVYENGGLRIDYLAGCVYVDGVEIHLTPIEYKLLCLLAKNTGKVLTHNYIINEVWGVPQASDVPTLRVFMATLRRKIEKNHSTPQYIQTHIGVGYRMLRH
ncbi:MAG TPA: response regulator transcription factor [Candidatus Pullichristensenella excrementipullorum]|nr:response regulator transcription factor [Candidatus Pullichristensenella excrementipullorum]